MLHSLYFSEILFFFSFRIQVEAKVSSKEDLLKVKQTETRILLLYSTKTEAENIMRWANEFELTTKNYIWIATQSVIGKERRASQEFPPGMLGMEFISIVYTEKTEKYGFRNFLLISDTEELINLDIAEAKYSCYTLYKS